MSEEKKEKVCKPVNPTFPGRAWECKEKDTHMMAPDRRMPLSPCEPGTSLRPLPDGHPMIDSPGIAPRLPQSPMPDVRRPPRMPEMDDSEGPSPAGGIIATTLAAGKNAIMFVATHPATPYALGAAAVAGALYLGYKWFSSASDDANQDQDQAEQRQTNEEMDRDENMNNAAQGSEPKDKDV